MIELQYLYAPTKSGFIPVNIMFQRKDSLYIPVEFAIYRACLTITGMDRDFSSFGKSGEDFEPFTLRFLTIVVHYGTKYDHWDQFFQNCQCTSHLVLRRHLYCRFIGPPCNLTTINRSLRQSYYIQRGLTVSPFIVVFPKFLAANPQFDVPLDCFLILRKIFVDLSCFACVIQSRQFNQANATQFLQAYCIRPALHGPTLVALLSFVASSPQIQHIRPTSCAIHLKRNTGILRSWRAYNTTYFLDNAQTQWFDYELPSKLKSVIYCASCSMLQPFYVIVLSQQKTDHEYFIASVASAIVFVG